MTVTEQVIAYQVKQVSTQATLDLVALDLPETTFETEAIWFSPPDELLEGIDRMPKLLGALHAAEHALIALLPLWAMCDRWDIGGLSTNVHFQTARPTIFVYDGHPGGVGITERGFEAFEGWADGHREDDRRLPVRARLPVVRPVAEVRQPERHARQGRPRYASCGRCCGNARGGRRAVARVRLGLRRKRCRPAGTASGRASRPARCSSSHVRSFAVKPALGASPAR